MEGPEDKCSLVTQSTYPQSGTAHTQQPRPATTEPELWKELGHCGLLLGV